MTPYARCHTTTHPGILWARGRVIRRALPKRRARRRVRWAHHLSFLTVCEAATCVFEFKRKTVVTLPAVLECRLGGDTHRETPHYYLAPSQA